MNKTNKIKNSLTASGILTVFLAAFVSTLLVAGVYVLFFAPEKKLEDTKQEPDILTEEEKNALGEKVVNLYSSETLPASEEGKDPLNYGLEEVEVGEEEPEGLLIFSGRKIRETDKYTQLYALDLSAGSTTAPELYIPKYFTSAMAEFEDSSEPADFFTLTASEYSLDNEEDGVGVHRYDSETGTVQPFSEATGKYERAIAWSKESELLAFSRLKGERQTDIDLLTLDNWETIIFHPETDRLVASIGGALYPKWSPDGKKVIFMKTEGLYMFDLETQKETEVIGLPEGGISIATSMMDLSDDGKYLIWSSAKSGMISISEIVSWETMEVKELGRMQVPDTEFYWPVFSPDGKYYAVQAIDTLKGNDFVRKNARIEVRPTNSRTVVYTHSLEDFFFDALFSDDWIAGNSSN
jgi:hypothetical protein